VKATKPIFAMLIVIIGSSFLLSSAHSSQDFPPTVANLDVGSTIGNNSVLYLNFDEKNGESVYDSSGKTNHGTLVNFNLDGSDGWADGIRGSALKFDGENDYALVQNSPSLNPEYLTLEAWVYLDELKGQAIVRKDPSYWFGVSNKGQIAFQLYINESWQGSWSFTPALLKPEKWYYIAVTYDGLYMRAYLDGVLVQVSSYIPGTIDPSETDISIGADVSRNTNFFNGTIDEVRIYSRALSDDEIWQHYVKHADGYIDFEPAMSWSYYSPDGDQQVKFHIQVGTNENDNSLWDYTDNRSDTWVKYNGLPLSTNVTYYARVSAYDGYAWSEWTSETFTILRQPKFELSNLTIEPKDVMPGGTVHISIDVTNVGEGEGSYHLSLKIGNVKTDTKVVTLGPGESERVTFTVTVEDKYDVDLGGMSGNFEIVYFSPAIFNFVIASFMAILLTLVAIFVKGKLKSGNKGA
jgi:hypothetical protein